MARGAAECAEQLATLADEIIALPALGGDGERPEVEREVVELGPAQLGRRVVEEQVGRHADILGERRRRLRQEVCVHRLVPEPPDALPPLDGIPDRVDATGDDAFARLADFERAEGAVGYGLQQAEAEDRPGGAERQEQAVGQRSGCVGEGDGRRAERHGGAVRQPLDVLGPGDVDAGLGRLPEHGAVLDLEAEVRIRERPARRVGAGNAHAEQECAGCPAVAGVAGGAAVLVVEWPEAGLHRCGRRHVGRVEDAVAAAVTEAVGGSERRGGLGVGAAAGVADGRCAAGGPFGEGDAEVGAWHERHQRREAEGGPAHPSGGGTRR